MALDLKLVDAVRSAASESAQPKSVATRLIAWLEALSNGNESLDDPDAVARHLDLLFDTVVVSEDPDAD